MITLALRGLRTAIRPSIYKLQPPSSSINRYSSSTKTTRTAQTIRIDKSTTTDTPRSLLNGPLSTHPPPLNLPTRETSSSTFSYFLYVPSPLPLPFSPLSTNQLTHTPAPSDAPTPHSTNPAQKQSTQTTNSPAPSTPSTPNTPPSHLQSPPTPSPAPTSSSSTAPGTT